MIKKLKKKSEKVRNIFLKLIVSGHKYHLGGSLSCLDFMTTAIYGGIINIHKKKVVISNLMNIKEDNDLIVNYFDKFSVFLSKNSLKIFTKDIIEFKF